MEKLTRLSTLQGRSYSMYLYHIMRQTKDFTALLQFENFICSHIVDYDLLVFYLVIFRYAVHSVPNSTKILKKLHSKFISFTIDVIGSDKLQDRLLFHYFTLVMDSIFKKEQCSEIRFHWNRHELYQISNPIRVENKSEKEILDLFRFVLLEKTLKDKDKEEKLKNGFYSSIQPINWTNWTILFQESVNFHYVLIQGNLILTEVPDELLAILRYASGIPHVLLYPSAMELIKLLKCSYQSIRHYGYQIVKNMLFELNTECTIIVQGCCLDLCQWIHKLLQCWLDPSLSIRSGAFQDLEEEEGEIGTNVGLFYDEVEFLNPSPILKDFFQHIDLIFISSSLECKTQIWDLLVTWKPPFHMNQSPNHPSTLYGPQLIETVKFGITRLLSLGDLWVDTSMAFK